MKKVVIIGGVAGGASCAARLRRLDEEAEIVLLERGDYISYANCGLPYHVGDVIKSRDALLVSTVETMKARFGIDVRTGHEALRIDREKKTVSVLDKKGAREYEESYDVLVLSTGSSPLRPPIPGIESDLIRTLWTIPDTDRIRAMARESRARKAAVIGGGFIGLEVAENLKLAGLDVDIVEALDQVMPPIDREMAQLLHENIADNGVRLHLGDPVHSFEELEENGKRFVRIVMASGKKIVTEFVVLSIGLRPNTELAREAGLTLNERGGVVVDESLKTSDENIYAVGDIAEIEDFTMKSRMQYQLAGPANKEGRIAANNIAGAREKYEGTQATSIAKVFDLAIGMTGQSEKSLVRSGLVKGRDFETAIVTQNHHAGYYPGATPLTAKLVYAIDGSRILGAQIVGRAGVDKRIDTISVAARLGAKATDLAKLELAYAPPYSSAKDPVNMLGFVVRNAIDGLVTFSAWDEPDMGESVLLDVREDAERLAFALPGSVDIPLGQLRERLSELDPGKPVIVFCSIGVRSYTAARILMQKGFSSVKVYPAGTRFYQATHFSPSETLPGGDSGVDAEENNEEDCLPDISIRLDCSGMQCPGPLLKVFETMQELEEGKVIEVAASDPGFGKDIAAWCRRTGNTLLSSGRRENEFVACVRKGSAPSETAAASVGNVSANGASATAGADGKTMVVFSGDMDRVLASFIIANGAAALGKPVTMFFTFWGLSALRRKEKVGSSKTWAESMFGAMLPRGAEKLKLSKMNMGGMGAKMMKKMMKEKNVQSLEELIAQAQKNGVKLVACTMSMEVMGIRPEELIDGVEFGGVGYYLGDAEEANVNLFI